jgi:hypothetical protein
VNLQRVRGAGDHDGAPVSVTVDLLQGRYIGYVRQVKPKQKTQVRKVKEAKD